MIFRTTGEYVNGEGSASKCADHAETFGCPMFGTFNVKCADPFPEDASASRVNNIGRFYLVRLAEKHYGYAFKWDGSRIPPNTIEVFSKALLADHLKNGNPFAVEILSPMFPDERNKWIADQHWFQSFPWGPQRADSGLVWDTINQGQWSGATVLDIGTHFGYFAFLAAKAGARVHGIDKAPCLKAARVVNDQIEMCDVTFSDSVRGWGENVVDYILYLSVHHQIDPEYDALIDTAIGLQARAKRAVYIELIDPPLEGPQISVESLLPDAEVLLRRYHHNVRKTRTILKLEGHAS